MMTYLGYHGSVSFDDEAEIFHGEVQDLKDVITFQGSSVEELKKSFQESIDDYLAFCRERGEEPDKPYSGRFVLRVNPQLHRKMSALSSLEGTSLNNWVSSRLEAIVSQQRGDQDASLNP